MATQNATGFQVGANINPFEQAMRRMVDSSRSAQGQVAAVFSKMNGILAASMAALAGGAMLKDAVNETQKFTGEANKLARVLGITATEASTLNVALGDIYTDADTFTTAASKMAKELRTNESALQGMGLKTRDSSGQLRPLNDLMMESILIVNSYKQGIDRNIAAQQLWGKSAEEVSTLLKLTPEVIAAAIEKQKELGLVVGQENVEASKAYKAAMNDVGDVMLAVKKTVGDAVIPVLTQLAELFAAAMPAAIFAFKIAINTLVTALQAVMLALKIVWDMVRALADPLFVLGSAIRKLLSGDMAGATKDMQGIFSSWGDQMSGVWDRVKNDSARTWKEVGNLWGQPTAIAPKKLTGRGATDLVKSGKEGEKDPSAMPTYEAALGQRKLTFERENTLREFSKRQELEYWRDILSTYQVGSKDRTAIALKTGKLELEILRQSAKEKSEIKQLRAEDYKAETLGFVDELEARAAFERDMGTSTQADFLARQAGFNQLRLQAELDFVAQKIEVANLDPDSNVVALEQLEMQKLEIKRKYKALELNLGREAALESTSQQREMFSGIRSGFESTTASMIQGTMTLQKGLQAIWVSIQQGFAQFIAKKVTDWALGETAQTTATVTGNSIRTASDWMAATKSVAANVWAGVKNIAIKAWEVAASVYAAIAAIPYVGPFLAPVMAVAATGVVLGYAANIASASQGFDIPKGMNPMTQLHEQEMVLPAKHANVIRSLADQEPGQGGGGSSNVVINVTTPNADSFRRSQRQIERAQTLALSGR